MSTLATYSFGSPSHSNQRKSNKRDPNWGRNKTVMFPGGMIPHIENPKEATRKLLELNEIGKVAGYQVYIQKPVVFLYTNKLIR